MGGDPGVVAVKGRGSRVVVFKWWVDGSPGVFGVKGVLGSSGRVIQGWWESRVSWGCRGGV